MTTIQSIQSNPNASKSIEPKQELGKEAFLKILVTQLQHQDPTQPQNDGEFIGQMAQLSVLEQLSNLNKSLTAYLESSNNISQHSYAIGNKVTWINPETNAQESGIVSGVHYKNNLVYYKVGEYELLPSEITSMEMDKK
ncbi:flagellar biosynthesis protein FlgD [Neobacillus notoginsengisoli]|uniref:Flagellar biosynthesis protein FlgD n=1 Tax=Neobacillus notoginsengisoli TaxID=1578198 RepID=A0A417YJM4_9BACI|nr:flagellar hook capping FlgD N-terminal domain-containing protein [Neobacillus notoginsengisoli]RHW33317.1 flagellar biosynthesis protein FlgD [Neobacillus notoginsengisoli]